LGNSQHFAGYFDYPYLQTVEHFENYFDKSLDKPGTEEVRGQAMGSPHMVALAPWADVVYNAPQRIRSASYGGETEIIRVRFPVNQNMVTII
jgi:hypothetical protein